MPHAYAQIVNAYFYAEHFNITEGLSQGVTYDMYADDHGFIWISSVGSLQLFDGKDFVSYDHLLSGSYYGVFSVHSTDALYFLYGNELIQLNPEAYLDPMIQRLTLPNPIQTWGYRFLYEKGDLLYISPGGAKIYTVSKETFSLQDSFVVPVGIARRQNLNYSKVLPDLPAHTIQYVGEDFALYELNSQTREIRVVRKFEEFVSITYTAADTLCILDHRSLHLYAGPVHLQFPLPAAMQAFLTSNLLRKDASTLLVGLHQHIYEFDLKKLTWSRRYVRPEGGALFDIQLRRMEVDQLGNLYYSTFTEGFVKLYARNPGFEYIGISGNRTSFTHCMEVSHDDNLVFLGSLHNGLFVFDTLGTLLTKFFDPAEQDGGGYIENVFRLSDQRYMVIKQTQAYIIHANEHGAVEVTESMAIHPRWSSYFSIVVSAYEEKKIYIVGEFGVLAIHDASPPRFEFHEGHLAMTNGIVRYQGGYLAAKIGSLVHFDKDFNSVPLASMDLPPIGDAKSMLMYDAEHVLIATLTGLYLVHLGDQAEIVRRIYDKVVYAVLSGENTNEYWFSTDVGLFVMDSTFALKRYPRESGLQENEFNSAVATRTASGKLYFGGINGITAFYPENVIDENRRHASYLKKLTVNAETHSRFIPGDSNIILDLAFRQNMLGFQLLAVSTKPPTAYNYQYFMDGLNSNWINMGRDPNINFHLSPGNYSFYYHISESFDPVAPKNSPVKIHIRQPFYRQWWFITILLCIAAGIAYALFRQNRKRILLKAAYERKLLEDLHTERMRISRELHDNIGAQMATVKRSVNFLTSNSDRLSDEQVQTKMHELESISTQINQQLRDTIWVTQHEQIPASAFIARLKNYVYQMLGQDSDWKVTYAENLGPDRSFGPFTALNLHRICQEALNNAMKHSGGNALQIAFSETPQYFRVTISDNGKGFDPALSADGYGLGNMKHRAAMINAELHMQSDEKHGTHVSVTITHDPKTLHS